MDALLAHISNSKSPNKKRALVVLSDSDSDSEDYAILKSLTPKKPKVKLEESDDEMVDMLTDLSESNSTQRELLSEENKITTTPRKSKRSISQLSPPPNKTEESPTKKAKLETPENNKIKTESEIKTSKYSIINSTNRQTKLPGKIITEEEEEKQEKLKKLSSKVGQFNLPPKCKDATTYENFQELEDYLEQYSNKSSALNIKSNVQQENKNTHGNICCLSIIYRYDSTLFRKSEISNNLKDEQQMRICENSMGIIIFPVESKSPYFLSLEKDSVSSLNSTSFVPLEERKNLIFRFLISESILKVTFCLQEFLQTIFFHTNMNRK